MKAGEVISICLVVAVGTYIVMAWMNKIPASAKFVTPRRAAVDVTRKVPWAVGDIGLYDKEDPNYCGKCKQWCDSAFFEGKSTQCDQCQSTCT